MAQEKDSASFDINFGVKLGTTFSNFTNQQPHNNIIIGFSSGIFASYSINDNMGVQVEGLYTQEGGRLVSFDVPYLLGRDFWYELTVDSQRVLLHNISVPILFQYGMDFSNIRVVASLGPDFSYVISAIAKKESTVFTEVGSFHTYTGKDNVTSNINRFNVAVTAGIGTKIPIGDFNLLFDFRYKYVFTTSYKSYSYMGIPQIIGDLKLHTFSLTAGIEF